MNATVANEYFEKWSEQQSSQRFSWLLRDTYVDKYSFAIPNQEAIDEILRHTPVVEIGCGLGYWAHLVRAHQGDIIAYDNMLNSKGKVKLFSRNKYIKPYTDVVKGDELSVENHADRTLLLCWPPMCNMGYKCLRAYLNQGGKKLIYIGEGRGGCTGDDDFHNLLRTEMECVKIVQIPRWIGINDRMYIYQAVESNPA